ncbi:hypothetical protein ACNFJN_08915 [Xenorhabdus budapestensis]|uniref:hypothetical protein n=1 Tax=Xenorhabdus budapestensis TaxID=290110 RepID=UPI003A86D397
MKNRFNHSDVHKNNLRDREARSVSKEGVKKLRGALEEAKLRKEHREELIGVECHE